MPSTYLYVLVGFTENFMKNNRFSAKPSHEEKYKKNPLFPNKISLKSVKSCQLASNMAQIEAYIYFYHFQVLKMCGYKKLLQKWARSDSKR